jgi:hypothetical protein
MSVDGMDENVIKALAEKHLDSMKLQRMRSYTYYLKMKDDHEYREKERLRKNLYYQQNKEFINEKDRERYHNDIEYHVKVREQAKARYKKNTENKPKLKRGRKPKVKPEEVSCNNDEQINKEV